MPVNVWFGNDRWPSGRNLGDFARDAFRLENAQTDKEKAFAYWKWIIRCMMRGANFVVPDGFGTYSRTFNPLMMFASQGSFECTGRGLIAAEALQAAGLKARRVVGQNDGHTIYEVWYNDAWHAFDDFQGWYFLNRNGEVASCEELTADHKLVHQPLGQASPSCYNIDMSYLTKRHFWDDALDIVQPVQNETLGFDIQPGQEYALVFRPANPDRVLYCGDPYPRGNHCQLQKYDHTGALLYPEHEPYWTNYRVNFHDDSWYGTHTPLRTHGSGALRWQPLLHGAEAADWSAHADFSDLSLSPTQANRHCEAWYHIKIPYYISYLQIEGMVRAQGSDHIGFSISADRGRTITPLVNGMRDNFRYLNGLEQRKKGETSVQYTREFWVRIDMHGHNPKRLPVLEGLRLTVGFQHNLFTQPFILPGNNRLYLEGKDLGKTTLSVRWNYTAGTREASAGLTLEKAGRIETRVDPGVDTVEAITLRGIVLSCAQR